jgi:hypothetical protein
MTSCGLVPRARRWYISGPTTCAHHAKKGADADDNDAVSPSVYRPVAVRYLSHASSQYSMRGLRPGVAWGWEGVMALLHLMQRGARMPYRHM